MAIETAVANGVTENPREISGKCGSVIPWELNVQHDAIKHLPWKVEVLTGLERVRGDVQQALASVGWAVVRTGAGIAIVDVSADSPAGRTASQKKAAEEVVREINASVMHAATAIAPKASVPKAPGNERKPQDAPDTAKNGTSPCPDPSPAADPAAAPRRFAGFRDWMSGGTRLSAYICLHAAEAAAVRLLRTTQLEAKLPAIRDCVTAYLQKGDSVRVALEGLPDLTAPVNKALMRPSGSAPQAAPLSDMLEDDQLIASEALAVAHHTGDRQQGEVKQFRGALAAAFAVLALAAAGVGIVGSLNPAYFPICGTASTHLCPSGAGAPGRMDIWLVMGMGVLGALLSAAFALVGAKPGGVHYSFSLTITQGLVKVALGALTAVIGIIVLRTLLSDHSGLLAAQADLLAAAVAFGFSQQAFTQVMDNKATVLIKAASPETPAQPAAGTAPAK